MKLTFTDFNNSWEFHTPEEMNEVHDKFWGAYDVMEYDPKKSIKVFLEIIYQFPECYIDAYVLLSDLLREQGEIIESFSYIQLAYMIGRSYFPPHFIDGKEKIPWGWLPNRPFLRSCESLARAFKIKGNIRRAIELFEENLSYNEGDNQGIRYKLLECYFEINDLKKIEKLFNKYPNDHSIDFTCGYVIHKILTGKNYTETDIDNINSANKFAIKEITKKTHRMPKRKPKSWEPNELEGIYVGSSHEAYLFWSKNKVLLSNQKIIEEFKLIKEKYC